MTHASPGDNMLAVPHHVSNPCSACSSDSSGHSAVTQQPAVTRCSGLPQDSLTGHLDDSALQTECVLEQEFKSRLDVLSQKLHGVDNVLGHQLAVHEMAGILGVGVPQVNTSYMSPRPV